MDYIKEIRPLVGHRKLILTAAGAIITRGDQILLQRRSDNGNWSLVGGLMEFKNILEKQKAPTEDVADLILKVIDAPKKRRKSIRAVASGS